ncbi:MAG: DUF1697 domain-containing protein [Microgenomates group bacterium]
MNTYIILLRGINVGGKNKIPMADLRSALEESGFSNVSTYIASGNIILDSHSSKTQIKKKIEQLLPSTFNLDSSLIKVLVLSPSQLRAVVKNKPPGFGESPDKFHSDVAFLIDITVNQAESAFQLREGVDTLWNGKEVIYFQRLSSQRTKSKLSKITASPLYKSMTIRNWNTTVKLAEFVRARDENN